jgi:CRISPR-associated protein Cas6
VIDLRFPLLGERIPADHAYFLYGALARLVPEFHHKESGLRFAPIRGDRFEKGLIQVTDRSHLVVRLPEERIRLALPLAGKSLSIGEHRARIGVPFVRALEPAPTLSARIVTYKHALTPESLLDHCRKQLAEMNIKAEPAIPLVPLGEHAGKPRRMVVRIRDRRVVGYALIVEGLNAEESVRLQEVGMGGRTKLGCGFFWPVRRLQK